MANPRDAVDPATGLLASLNGEYYLNERTGRTHIRVPAGGSGGGVTSYADVPATEEQHVAFLKAQADAKKQEGEALAERHGKAHEELKKQQAEEEKEAKAREATEDEGGREPANPIDQFTYGRPPLNPPPLEGQAGPRNPGDQRDYRDPNPLAPATQPPPQTTRGVHEKATQDGQ